MNNPPRILVVDDVPDTVEILSRQLRQEGYEVLSAYNAKDSIESAQNRNPDLILMDISLPDMDGFQATKIIKEKNAGMGIFLPIIIVTATKDDTASIVRGLQCGADDYITLPCEKEIILARVRSMLRNKRSHDELNHANTMKVLFLAGMAHQLRTPTTAIQGFTQLLLEDKTITKSQKRDVKHIHTNAKRLIHLMEEILELSTIIAGKTKLEPERFNINSQIKSLLSSIKPILRNKPRQMRDKRIKLISSVGNNMPVLNTDLIRVRQIIDNLLSNAQKFSEEGEIRINCGMDDKGMVNISVSDTGIGIKEEILPYIFEEFSKVNDSIKQKYGGSGLGLSISKRLARLLGGDISVKSVFGKGSTFTFTFPPTLNKCI